MLPCAAQGVFCQDFPPLLLPSPVKLLLRSRSCSGAWVSLEVRSGGEMLLCQASSLRCHSEITCRGLGTAPPAGTACSFCPSLCLCGRAGSRFGVAATVDFTVHGRGVAPLCVLYKKSRGSTALSIAQRGSCLGEAGQGLAPNLMVFSSPAWECWAGSGG